MSDFYLMTMLMCNKMYLQKGSVIFFSGMAILIISGSNYIS